MRIHLTAPVYPTGDHNWMAVCIAPRVTIWEVEGWELVYAPMAHRDKQLVEPGSGGPRSRPIPPMRIT
jgi:hypothetical protein